MYIDNNRNNKWNSSPKIVRKRSIKIEKEKDILDESDPDEISTADMNINNTTTDSKTDSESSEIVDNFTSKANEVNQFINELNSEITITNTNILNLEKYYFEENNKEQQAKVALLKNELYTQKALIDVFLKVAGNIDLVFADYLNDKELCFELATSFMDTEDKINEQLNDCSTEIIRIKNEVNEHIKEKNMDTK